ncbi:hypothetical protein [Phaeodactylibacter luteus]|uniref:Lipoprotein n=1 Tax=Phaeodactylibacter luteus TaxID=1564516 RepID=A0A5C6S9H9_9BACT|nr:hypothetical protein [Phaeodactylibacter luteus]TXB70234.1 hypothetical protein FRY97_00580 [Phaeodactylibacter luteus]
MRYPSLIFPLLAIMLLGACAAPHKLVDQGRYDDAIAQTVRRLAGQKHKKEKLVLALEEAFAKANSRDLSAAGRLKLEGRPENWAAINRLYRGIRERQEAVAPLLPLVAKSGIQADFRFARIDELELESREKAAAYYYGSAQQLLSRAEQGDKQAAREAFGRLESARSYFSEYRDAAVLMQRARQLGTTRVLMQVEPSPAIALPARLSAQLKAIGVAEMNRFWESWHTAPVKGLDFDYEAVVRIDRVEVTPGLVRERAFQETATVQDGLEYVLDERGNVAKDSLGNDIKQPRYVEVVAEVLQQTQQQSARLSGRLEFRDLRSGTLLATQPLFAEAHFEHVAATFRGDERALSKATRLTLGRPVPFPPGEALLLEAAEQLKPAVKARLRDARGLL